MPRHQYTAILFQTNSNAFKNDEQLAGRIREWTGKNDFALKRENYADDRWSGWFSIKSERHDPWEFGHAMEKMPGLGPVMLRAATGQVVSLHTAPKLGLGAIVDRKPPKM
jgi:hypothetical protein